MSLSKFFQKKIRVITLNGEEIIGYCDWYIPSKDNDIPEDSVAITELGVGFYESDIKSIEILEN